MLLGLNIKPDNPKNIIFLLPIRHSALITVQKNFRLPLPDRFSSVNRQSELLNLPTPWSNWSWALG